MDLFAKISDNRDADETVAIEILDAVVLTLCSLNLATARSLNSRNDMCALTDPATTTYLSSVTYGKLFLAS